ncbi:adenylate/guanylate cyclase domain-containing protein [Mesorhizobium mediterraneum]|uniref:adenylate/guanylate cyclase domain-containing protein n=1 Tax=Mesorhizobium mediterraneum TaxID=43617 RepID=UPI0017874970|nr:adenylate/guanylate cyclase domain-containing protein [Mesorhizobium mediterraneum]
MNMATVGKTTAPRSRTGASFAISGQGVGVLAADLVGYSELVFRDAHHAVTVMRDTRRVLTEILHKQDGRVVETPGDFVLAFFNDPSRLLVAAYEAQDHLYRYHQARDDFSSGHWKIGLEFGVIHVIDGDYYGNAINVAARLQSLAAPGEIWFTNAVSEISRPPEGARIRELGSKQLKNIGDRLQVWCAGIPGYAERMDALRPVQIALPSLDRSLRKPVLLVRPFKQIGTTKRGRLISEALVEEIKLIISRLSGSIAITQSLNMASPNYVLHGSVQSLNERVRITAQLASATDGLTVWADRFESDLNSSFDFQDQIARDIVSALQLTLTEGEQAQLWRRGTTSGQAWEAFQRGHDHERRYTRQGHQRAKACYQEALSLDPEYLCALVALGFCHLDEVRLGWSNNESASLAIAAALCADAQALASDHPDALALQAYIFFFGGHQTEAKRAMRKAVALAPQSIEIIAYEGALLDLIGDFAGAVGAYKEAISISPYAAAWIGANLGLSLLALNENTEAEWVFKEVLKNHPDYARAWIGLTVALVRQGSIRDAEASAKTLMTLDPRFTINGWAKSRPFSNNTILEHFTSDLRAAGLT